MSFWTCEQCGAQFPDSTTPPASCPICEDERQYVNWKGQTWLTREQAWPEAPQPGLAVFTGPAPAPHLQDALARFGLDEVRAL